MAYAFICINENYEILSFANQQVVFNTKAGVYMVQTILVHANVMWMHIHKFQRLQ